MIPYTLEAIHEDLSILFLVERILARMPLGQVLPDGALVEPIRFLASDPARWVNGRTLHVDVGFNVT